MKKFSMIVTSILLVGLFAMLLSNYSDRFDEVNKMYREEQQTRKRSAINLAEGVDVKKLKEVILLHNYISNEAEADMTANFLADKFKKGQELGTLYDLNKRAWQIPVSKIDSIQIELIEKAKKEAEAKKQELAKKKEAAKKQKKGNSKKQKERAEEVVEIQLPQFDQYSLTMRAAKSKRNLGHGELDTLLALFRTDSVRMMTFQKDSALLAQFRADSTGKARFIVEPSVFVEKDASNILVHVTRKIENAKPWQKKAIPCKGVLVRLSEQFIDSLNNAPARRVVALGKTDKNGNCLFEGLNPELSYSVLPINEGFEYGSSKGTIGGNLAHAIAKKRSLTDKILGFLGKDKNTLTCSFSEQEHRLRIFDAYTLKQIKEDHTLTIRTPDDFKGNITSDLMLFFAAWWGLWLFARMMKKPLDTSMVALLMALTGLCLLTMYSLNDPLTDKLLGADMAFGIIGGVCAIIALLNVNFKKLYQNQSAIDFDIPIECFKWVFKPFRNKVSYLTKILADKSRGFVTKSLALVVVVLCLPLLILDLCKVTALNEKISNFLDKLPKGSGYLLASLFLTALLFTPLGAEVGGMKVNLNIGIKFQPSEIAKYLIIFFMASYFSTNVNKIVQYSREGNTKLFGAKMKMLAYIILGLGALMGLYLALGDMGPALVLTSTFIILYSIIKSKIDLEDVSAEGQIKRIFTCDIAMLIYGVISFIVFLYIGNILSSMDTFCIAWFVVWIVIGITRKQICETPIFFNLMIAAFLFGGTLLSKAGLNSIADRLEDRTEMCTNTWGQLPLNGEDANAGANTQVAEGLWGLASGGFGGQGLGNGSPHFIPAFHTDMILESMGEQMGFLGVFIVFALLAVLLRKTIILGYRTAHPFTFYLCLGIAIVTAIQFIIISLGSTGMIPLTGVTVPFLSYGKVSMVLNLVAFGVIISIASHAEAEAAPANKDARQNISKYNYSVSLLSWTYCVLAIFICGVFFHYQFTDRNDTLIRPVYVNNESGIPIVEYNPRIAQLTEKMPSGDIYDRNGVLLATSDKTKLGKHANIYKGLGLTCDTLRHLQRYYPFGEHLVFMVGDRNSSVLALRDEENGGYLADWRHLSQLRGFDNSVDEDGNSMPKLTLESDSCKLDKWHTTKQSIAIDKQLYNYGALIPYLKAGWNSDKVRDVIKNKDKNFKPEDIHLTIDAKLQTTLQKEIEKYINTKYADSDYNKIRASVVILDANKGDLLASANYPLPDKERLEEEADNKYYSDNYTTPNWRAYTDRDLGLFRYTEPGSTAKILSSMAAMRKDGVEISQQRYLVHHSEIIMPGEANGQPADGFDIKYALRYSSNCYFVNLVNDKNLYSELADIYGACGISIFAKPAYSLFYNKATDEWKSNVKGVANNCTNAYKKYKKSGKKEKMNNKTGKPAAWSWAWGQNDITATPAAMARAISTVVNGGNMPATRFLLTDTLKHEELISNACATELVEYLKFTAKGHDKFEEEYIGGKTGTPERPWVPSNKGKEKIINDGWYVCFIEGCNITAGKENKRNGTIAIAVRLERLNDKGSGRAVRLTKEVVLKVLRGEAKGVSENSNCKYIN